MSALLKNQPELPYNGTSGHSGTDTSRQRALSADRSGKTALRQAQALNLLSQRDMLGLTWKELSQITGLHHGTASGVLSVLHKTGRIARLKESRDGCKVYVDVSFIEGRVVEKQGRKKCCPHCGGNL
jgi:DNA-binding MarR family transcriptional regulator